MQPHEKAFEKCKLQLMMKPNTVFYTTILFSLLYFWAEDNDPMWGGRTPTAAVDGKRMWTNPGFFMGLDEDERIFLILHEILHVALCHMTRINGRHARVWNHAGDYVINLMLVEAGFKMPKIGLYDVRFKDMSTEEVYDVLMKEITAKIQQMGGDINVHMPSLPGIGEDIIPPGTPAEIDELAQDIADILVHAKIQSEAAGDRPGTVPGEVAITIENLINPKLPWEVILQNYLDDYNKDDYTMQRPNRRFMPKWYLPTCRSEAICNLVIAVDGSCSVSHSDFSYFCAEISKIQERMKPDLITLITFDTKIRQIDEITTSTDIMKDIEFKAGGGTQLNDLMSWMDEHQPTVALIFSDGEFREPKEPDHTDIIWIIHDDEKWKCSYGQVVHYELRD